MPHVIGCGRVIHLEGPRVVWVCGVATAMIGSPRNVIPAGAPLPVFRHVQGVALRVWVRGLPHVAGGVLGLELEHGDVDGEGDHGSAP